MAVRSPFTYTQRVVLGRMRRALDRQSLHPISLDFGTTEDGLLYHATFSIAEGAGPKEPIASVLTGPAIGGDGYAVLAADGSTLANRISFASAAKVAHAAAWRTGDMGLEGLTFQRTASGELQMLRKPVARHNKA